MFIAVHVVPICGCQKGRPFLIKKTLTMIWFVCFFTADTIKDAVMLTIARLTLTSTLIKGQEKYADNAVRFTHLYLRGTIRPGCTTQNFSRMAIKVIFSTCILVAGKKKWSTNV